MKKDCKLKIRIGEIYVKEGKATDGVFTNPSHYPTILTGAVGHECERCDLFKNCDYKEKTLNISEKIDKYHKEHPNALINSHGFRGKIINLIQ